MLPLADFCSYYAPIGQLRRTAAGAAAREQEPVDKDAFTVVLRVVREQAVVGVLLLAETVAAAATRLGAPGTQKAQIQTQTIIRCSPI